MAIATIIIGVRYPCFACSCCGDSSAMAVLWLDLFGRRYDYEKDFPLEWWQLLMAGPIIWYVELKKRWRRRRR